MKMTKPADTTECKERAVQRVKEGQRIRAVVKELGLGDPTLRHGIKASAEGQLNGAGRGVVTPAERELSRLRAEHIRLKRENERLTKAAASFAKDAR
jgi:transposase